MKKRLESMERVVGVQRQLRRMAEVKLAELERHQASLAASRQELVSSLNEDTMLHGLFIEAMARRVKSVSSEISDIERLKDAQAKRLLDQTSRLKRAERVVTSLEREYEAELEKRDLADLIDALKPTPPE
jgi:chromosome segregation ATPase